MRGYHTKRDLLSKGWAHVAPLGRDIPTQADIRASARSKNIPETNAGAWRLGDGVWHLFRNAADNTLNLPKSAGHRRITKHKK